MTYRGEVLVPNAHPAIVDQDVWDRVQALRQRRATRPSKMHHRGREYLLTGLAVCCYCGSTMWASNTNSGAYYRCSATARGLACPAGNRGIRADEAERQATALALALNVRPDWRDEAKRLAEETTPVKVDQRAALEARHRRLLSMMADGLMDYERGADEVRTVKAQLEALPQPTAPLQTAERVFELRTEWEQAPVERRRAMLSALFAFVVIEVQERAVCRLVPHAGLTLSLLDVLPGIQVVSGDPDRNGAARHNFWARLPGLVAERADRTE